MCALRRRKHSVYDLTYHFVRIPKYRKKTLTAEVADMPRRRLNGLLRNMT